MRIEIGKMSSYLPYPFFRLRAIHGSEKNEIQFYFFDKKEAEPCSFPLPPPNSTFPPFPPISLPPLLLFGNLLKNRRGYFQKMRQHTFSFRKILVSRNAIFLNYLICFSYLTFKIIPILHCRVMFNCARRVI